VGSAGHATDPGGTDRAQPSYLVMEFVDGPSLAQRLTGAPLSPDEVNGIGVGIAGALQVLHARDLVHRDVKPGNILLTSTGVAKLSDFGIAKMLHAERVTNSVEVVGTAPYLSPEQARGGDVGPASDIYALGLVLLECLTGHREFPGPAVEAAVARLLRDPAVPDALPTPWPALLRSMTGRQPGDRPTAQDVVTTLTASSPEPATRPGPAVTSLGAPDAPTTRLGGGPLSGATTRVLPVRSRSRRVTLILAAAAVAAAGILTITALTLTGADPAPAPPPTNLTDTGRTDISATPTPNPAAPVAGSATPGPDTSTAALVTIENGPDPTTSIAPPPTTPQATSADTPLTQASAPAAIDPAVTNPDVPKGKDKDPKTNGNNGEPKKTKQNNGQ
jgi:serine/threonine protein kinase